MRTKRKGRTKTEPVSKKAPGLLNKFSLGIAVGVVFVVLLFWGISYILLICLLCK